MSKSKRSNSQRFTIGFLSVLLFVVVVGGIALITKSFKIHNLTKSCENFPTSQPLEAYDKILNSVKLSEVNEGRWEQLILGENLATLNKCVEALSVDREREAAYQAAQKKGDSVFD